MRPKAKHLTNPILSIRGTDTDVVGICIAHVGRVLGDPGTFEVGSPDDDLYVPVVLDFSRCAARFDGPLGTYLCWAPISDCLDWNPDREPDFLEGMASRDRSWTEFCYVLPNSLCRRLSASKTSRPLCGTPGRKGVFPADTHRGTN